MSADLLREAASEMRQRAEATVVINTATRESIPWHTEEGLANEWDEEDAAHIAGMSPAVALALADWLDKTAEHMDPVLALDGGCWDCEQKGALVVARAYLGSER